MLAQSLIAIYNSSVVHPVLLLPKSDSTLQPYIKFKCLNAFTDSDYYLILLMYNVIMMIFGATIFSKLDFKYVLYQFL